MLFRGTLSMKLNSIYIKLGSDCNLHCKYCHAEHKNIQFNPAILPILKSFDLKLLVFGGGEPLLYWNLIKKIVLYLGKDVTYKIVTNGTLFTQEIVDFCNQYNFLFHISMDGIDSTRDMSKPVKWELIKQLKFCGTAVTFYKENSDIRKTLKSLNEYKEKYLSINSAIWSSFPNFVHSINTVLSDKELADLYIVQMTDLIKDAVQIYKKNNKHATIFLKRAFNEFVKVKSMNGVFCCRDNNILMLADGTVCSCPYTFNKIGDIFHLNDINWNEIKERYSRNSCKRCDIFTVCGNRCHEDITDNLCYVMKNLHKNFMDIMEENNISYDEFDKNLRYL